ncbi:hypothetical protein GCM10027280_56100 [Micromonospora polyrhachis]|uniref:Uncharacterized protein n=1 Tax=Micromonospora polyrhachis TaxID=1282883 RepID=A0A7W7STF3_9ACTN|nr:hypothetical protein [Micromonospora polyrhachis]MBB4960548.1 hypothetical protein [Micromonospora polyrhachis]
MVDQTQPWAERTVEVPPQRNAGFRPGVASVGQPTEHRREPSTEPFPVVGHEPSGTGWPGEEQPRQRMPLSYHMQQLRRGGEWSAFGALFSFICWGIWAISARGDLTSPVLTFVLTVLVAIGLFALARLVGRVVWERQFGRVRRTAKGAHLVAGVFLFVVGVAYLRQTEWVISAWNWVTGR